jgi:hypothetical protein
MLLAFLILLPLVQQRRLRRIRERLRSRTLGTAVAG